MISYAQNFEDVMLWRALGHIENGFYIDVGAQDPIKDSVSRAFYEKGWRGIHVEPTQFYANRLRENRPDETVLQTAVGNDTGVIQFFEILETGISTGDAAIAKQHQERGFPVREITVPCITLASVFKLCAGKEIHWLKIDVEGMENQVIKSWKPAKSRPWVIVIESTLPLTQIESYDVWEPLILEKGYKFSYYDGLNRFYVSNSHPELLWAFLYGPNVFDGFKLNGTASASFHALLQDKITLLESRLAEVTEAGAAALAAQQQSLATSMADQEQEFRAQLVSVQAELVEKEKALAAMYQAAQQEVLKSAQALATREREFSTQGATQERAHHNEIAFLQSEVVRTNGLLIAAKDEFSKRNIQFEYDCRASQEKNESLNYELHSSRADVARLSELMASREMEFSYAIAAQVSCKYSLESELHTLQSLLSSQAERAKVEFAAHVSEVDSLTRAHELIAADLASHRQTNASLQRTCAELARQIELIHVTLSWRISARFRKIANFVFPRVANSCAELGAEIIPDLLPVIVQPKSFEAPMAQPIQASQFKSPATASTLEELLSHYDEEFIACVYRTLLGRVADPEGFKFYISKLRDGISKIQIISDIRRSPEGRRRSAPFQELDRAINRYRFSSTLLIGWIIRGIFGGEGNSPVDKKVRSVHNEILVMRGEVNQRLREISGALEGLRHIRLQQGHAIEAPLQNSQKSVSRSASVSHGENELLPRTERIFSQLTSAINKRKIKGTL